MKNKTYLQWLGNGGKVFSVYLLATIIFAFAYFSQLVEMLAESELWAVILIGLVWLGFGIGSTVLAVKTYNKRND